MWLERWIAEFKVFNVSNLENFKEQAHLLEKSLADRLTSEKKKNKFVFWAKLLLCVHKVVFIVQKLVFCAHILVL